jgi:hypothetical protein
MSGIPQGRVETRQGYFPFLQFIIIKMSSRCVSLMVRGYNKVSFSVLLMKGEPLDCNRTAPHC